MKLSDQLKPLFYVNIFFGLPRHYKKNNFLIVIYALFLSIAIPCYILYTLFQRAKPNKPDKNKMKLSVSSLMNYIQVNLVIAAVSFIYLRNYFRRFIFQYVLQHIEQVDEKLQSLFHFENRELKIATIAQFPVIIIYGSTQSMNFGFKMIILKRSLIQAVATTFVNTLLFLLMFQMVIYSKILKNRFSKLNTFLVKLITSRVYSGTIDKERPSHLTHLSNKEKRFHILNVTSIHEINHQLKQLIVLHYELNKVCDALNDSYNVQITIVIAVTVLGVASMLQTTSTNLINYFYKNAKNLWFILYVCFWISLGMLCLFWLISNISNMQSEGNLTPLLAHKLMLERHEFREQVLLFTKVIHVKAVEFSACKLFPINHSLVFASQSRCRVESTSSPPITAVKQRRAWIVSGWVNIEDSDHVRLALRPNPGWILGAITTYWAILIQFQLQLQNS